MLKLTEEEIAEAKRQLGGIKILLWLQICGGGLISLIVFISFMVSLFESGDPAEVFGMFIGVILITEIYLLPQIFAILGIKNKRPYAVILIRVILILTMLNIPVGTIIGAILWSRVNHPITKKYLCYGINKSELLKPLRDFSKDKIKTVINTKIHCPNCGVQLSSEAVYCKKCGKRID